jgi:phosphatidylserine/phosphatidylglycerophosphate/cardiolipin synthase-like enzyme
MRRVLASLLLAALLTPAGGCGGDDPLDGEAAGFPDGKADGGIDEGSAEARAVLALVNDRRVDVATLDGEGGLHLTAATNIVAHRDGPDGVPGTADDDPYDSLAELDAVPFVGPVALARLLDLARARGLVDAAAPLAVIFSPQPRERAHTARVEALIRGASRSIDVAMYSFSDAGVSAALADAAARGVAIRFLFETANTTDKKLTGDALASSKSGRLERAGIDVRFVNKTMHHKFMIVDGPRDDAALAATATIATGSANWSTGGASVFDENTVFMTGHAELAAAMQREFDLLWRHSRDLVVDAPRPFEVSTADLDGAGIPDDPDLAFFSTSANMTVADGSTTFRTDTSKLALADQFVAAIGRADRSILLASGHLRLRPVAEALIAARQRNPALEVRVYLDQQEYLSVSGQRIQEERLETCLAGATDDRARFACLNRSQLFGKQVGDAGIEVRYKTYAYRWDHAYAVQMHHKYMVVDGDELLTGSYNLSINAEHDTFDNTLHLRGPRYAELIAAFEANFEAIWRTGRDDGTLAGLEARITGDPLIPLVFDSMALSWQEVTDLKALLRANCEPIDSDPFRTAPAAHKLCPR